MAIDNRAKGVLLHSPEHLLQAFTIIIMTKMVHMTVSMDLEFDAPKLVKVKAHTRILNGKVVKVRSHYRSVEGRKVVSARFF